MTELLVLNAGKQEMQEVSLDGKRVRTLISGLDEMPTSSRFVESSAPLDHIAH